MKTVISLAEVGPDSTGLVGGKAVALATMARHGFVVPGTFCVTTAAYRGFIGQTGVAERISRELERKDFRQMRWEEVWDSALRIRNMFLTTSWPEALEKEVVSQLSSSIGQNPVAVRSSAPGEDSGEASFAGLHESYVNVIGMESILHHIRLVWASLWSDAALLYRRELGLDVRSSAMAVLVQNLVVGEVSGVVFSENPNNERQGVVEAVYGLNQGLVDGVVEPDRWIMDRETGRILSHRPVERAFYLVPEGKGVAKVPLPSPWSQRPPLTSERAQEIFALACRSETLFGAPQDLEWTLAESTVYALQSRPITTRRRKGEGGKRSWYLSLHRSFENLKSLRRKIEEELLPVMIGKARELESVDLKGLSDGELAEEIEERYHINHHWTQVYWSDFIPYAHGIRLFGQVYNDAVKPENPFEFVALLVNTPMASLERNRRLEELAAMLREDVHLQARVSRIIQGVGQEGVPPGFDDKFNAFLADFGDPATGEVGQGSRALLGLIMEMALHPKALRQPETDAALLEARFISRFKGSERAYAKELLDLGRSSYQVRDDDNIYLGRLEAQLGAGVAEARQRLAQREKEQGEDEESRLLRRQVEKFAERPTIAGSSAADGAEVPGVKARQIVGQPAGPGFSRGVARVIRTTEDLADFRHGEILVCDAVDPNMTHVVPLAAGIVERRGGMLIHGAIIAREYGLPCVTGVSGATKRIVTGDVITVDGFLGIVIIGEKEFSTD